MKNLPSVVSIDGSVLGSLADARISIADDGWLFGDGVFETLRTYGGRPWALREHLDRLASSAELVLMPIPDLKAVELHVQSTLAAIHPSVLAAGVAIRILVTSTGKATSILVVVRPVQELISGGPVRVTFLAEHEFPRFRPSAKTLSFLSGRAARREARRRGFDDAVLVGDDGLVLEGCTSAVVMVREGEFVAPIPGKRNLPSVTAEVLSGIARARGWSWRWADIPREDFELADEAFLTASLRGIQPIRTAEQRTFLAGAPGPWTQLLSDAFHQHVHATVG